MPNDESVFGPEDVELLERVMSLVPDLDAAAGIVKITNQWKIYPINEASVLLPVFDKMGGTVEVGSHKLTYEHVKRFFPTEWFPIEDERQLMTRLFLAFKRGELVHATEAALAPASNDLPRDGMTIIPAPSVTFADLVKMTKG